MDRINAGEMPPPKQAAAEGRRGPPRRGVDRGQLAEAEEAARPIGRAGRVPPALARGVRQHDPRPARRHLRRHRPDRPAGRPGLARLPAGRLGPDALAGARREVPRGGGGGAGRGPADRPAARAARSSAGGRSTCAAALAEFEKEIPGARHRGQGPGGHRPQQRGRSTTARSTIKTPGDYLVRVKLSGLRPEGRPRPAAAPLRQRPSAGCCSSGTWRRPRTGRSTLEFRDAPARRHATTSAS